MTKFLSMVLVVLLLNATGCASYMSYKSSQDEIYKQRVFASGNVEAVNALRMGASPRDAAIKAVPVGNSGAGIGIDISNTDALAKHPWRQIGAALIDAAMLYGSYEGVRALDGDDDKDDKNGININVTGSEDTDITVIGRDGKGKKITTTPN